MAKGGLIVVAGYILIWLFHKLINKLFKDDSDKSELLTKEREELKQAVVDKGELKKKEKEELKQSLVELRGEISSLHIYIRTEHKDTIDKNTTAYNNMCVSHTQLCTVIADLSKNMKERRVGDKI